MGKEFITEEENMIIVACRDNDVEYLKNNLNKDIIDGFKMSDGFIPPTPLQWALGYSSKEAAIFLLENGSDPNQLMSMGTRGEEMYYVPILNVLVYSQTGDGRVESRQEYYHMLEKNLPMLELLIKFGANVNGAGENGYTPLDYAVEHNHPYAKKLLKKHGALHSKRFIDESYKTYYRKEPSDKIKFIETKFVDKRLPPYHHDIKWEHHNYKNRGMELTIGWMEDYYTRGIDINQKDWKGRTPLDFALELGHHVAVEFLRKHGGKTSKELEQD